MRCRGQGGCLWARSTGHESTLWFLLGHGFLVDGLVESLRCCAQGEHESGSRGQKEVNGDQKGSKDGGWFTSAPRRGKKKPSAGAGVQGAAPPGFRPLVAQYTGYRLRNAQFSLRPDAIQGVASIRTPLHAPLPVRHSPVRSAPPSGVHRTTAGTRLCGVGTVPGRRVFRAARASASLAKSATVSRDASCSMRTRCESSEPLTRRRACWRLQSWLGLVLTDADRQTYPYLVEPVRVVRLSRCLRVGFSRFTRKSKNNCLFV